MEPRLKTRKKYQTVSVLACYVGRTCLRSQPAMLLSIHYQTRKIASTNLLSAKCVTVVVAAGFSPLNELNDRLRRV